MKPAYLSLRRLGALSLSIIETTLIFGGIPLAVVLAVYGAVYAGTSRRSRRYRPGRSFEFTPVWFLSSPELLTGNETHAELSAAPARAALDAAGEWPAPSTTYDHATGGASDRW